MPTYDYVCKDCDHAFEHFQTMTSDHLTECPECKGNLKRLIGSGAALIFKGSGFYCTDYKKGDKKKGSSKEKPSEKSLDEKVERTKDAAKYVKETSGSSGASSSSSSGSDTSAA